MLYVPPLVLLFETDIICQIYYNYFNTINQDNTVLFVLQ
jgi:hypothetical protein